ncbi:oligosaccharide repeat unit polymerase [Leptothermofonsia sp. ETS-13]|uniref:oligosaccharide repeat unit polymerase n=1 Tax=Leptothermofonsia sp. ETS-13 TaxID=3035696 RepID=UPI003BA0654B
MSTPNYLIQPFTYPYFEQKHYPPAASVASTSVFLIGLAAAYAFIPASATPSAMARTVAIIVAIALGISVFLDSKKGLQNLFRTDLLCLVGLYFLTLVEFLFPQEEFDRLLTVEQTNQAISIVLIGMACLAIGRHLVSQKAARSSQLNFGDISNQLLFNIVIVAAFLGFLDMLLSVNFDIFRMIDAMLAPRFAQPWGRGRLGGWRTFLSELNLLLYVIPALAGVVWNRRRSFPSFQLGIILLLFLFVLFQGFAGGTRNVFIAYLSIFVASYLVTLPTHNFRNTVIPILAAGFITVFASYHMLEFRTIGLRNYLENQVYASDTVRDTLSVDYNLWSIGLIANALPRKHDFLGLEVIYWALIRPIPRVLFPDKPEGLSVSIEEIVDAEGWTVSSTYLGEAYMAGGMVGVIAISLFFGALAAWWNRMALQRKSAYAMMTYSLGFAAAGITMRSLFWLTTMILPIVALLLLKKLKLVRLKRVNSIR